MSTVRRPDDICHPNTPPTVFQPIAIQMVEKEHMGDRINQINQSKLSVRTADQQILVFFRSRFTDTHLKVLLSIIPSVFPLPLPSYFLSVVT